MCGKLSELHCKASLISNHGKKIMKWRKTVGQIYPILFLAFQTFWRTTKHQIVVMRVFHAWWHIFCVWKTVRPTFWHTVVSQMRGDCSIMWHVSWTQDLRVQHMGFILSKYLIYCEQIQMDSVLYVNKFDWIQQIPEGLSQTILVLLLFSKYRPSEPMLSISQNVRAYVCVFTFEVPFKRLFAPTSWSLIFGILGEKKWKKVDSDLNIFCLEVV